MTTPSSTAETAPPKDEGKKGGGLIRSSMIYSGLTLISRFMGLARDLVITSRFGASATIEADAYNTAFSFPNLFRRIFAEGAFASAFVPAYSKSLERDGEEVADILAADAMATLAAATLVITLIAQLTMPWLMYVINPGYAHDPDKFKLAILLTQISMPYLPCMAIAAHLSGVLNARGRFIVSGLHPTLLNLVMLLAVIPQHDPHSAALAATWAIIVAGVCQAGLLWWGVNKSGARVTWRWPRLTPEIKQLIALAVPGSISASATQINIFISGILASQVAGARSWLATADRLYQLPLSLIGVAVGVALLPRLSRTVHAGDQKGAQDAMDGALVFCLALTLPAAAALISIPEYLIDGIWRRGEFTHYDAVHTGQALLFYGIGVPAFVLNRILQTAFFARQDTKTPMRFALISVAINVVLGVVLFAFTPLKVAGIAAATAIASWVNVAQMLFTLSTRDHYAITPETWSKIVRTLAASALMGVALFVAQLFRPQLEAPLAHFHLLGLGAKEIVVLSLCFVAAVLYPFVLFAFGGLSMSDVRAALRRAPRKNGEEPPPDLPPA
ncbi:MAG: murein biosynthesis integral membrane protein MurJ [Terricaulis sp.]